MFSLPSDTILMTEEKQRIILLERVNSRPLLNCLLYTLALYGANGCLFPWPRLNPRFPVFPADVAHEGRRKQAPQSATGRSRYRVFNWCFVPGCCVAPPPLGGSSIKETLKAKGINQPGVEKRIMRVNQCNLEATLFGFPGLILSRVKSCDLSI